MQEKKLILKNSEIKVLDHGFVRYIDHMGDDTRIVEAARISYRSPSKGETEDKKLIDFLWRNKHTSPFEQVKITFNIKMPIFVMREYVRHRMQNLNEVSARYTELPNEFYIPEKWRKQDTKNKQGSIVEEDWHPLIKIDDTNSMGDLDGAIKLTPTQALERSCDHSYQLYKSMLEAGIARELARMVLPINIYTEIYSCWDLKNLLHFITLRDAPNAQWEIQQFAKAIKQICTELFPVTLEVYEKYKSNNS
jgi:thymidylate synthase (FAD)